MRIQNSAVNIMFHRVGNIKKQYILNEDILKERFNEANILPIPDDAPAEIPRVLVTSKGEHSQINIAPEAVNFQTKYTDEYVSSWELCEQYINSRLEDIFEITDKFTLDKYNYIGVVANLIWDEVESEGNKALFQNLFGKAAAENLDDLEVKYTYVEDEKYYVNIILQSIKLYEKSRNQESGIYTNANLQSHTIGITLDINDRFSFNQNRGYVSSKEKFKELMGLTTSIIKNKLKNLVEKGEY